MAVMKIGAVFAFFFLFQIYSTELISKTFRCRSEEYVQNSTYCDGNIDCIDGSDEPSGCWRKSWKPKRSCGQGKFRCSENKSCINVDLVCNTHIDCPNGTDEINCGDEINVQSCLLSDGKFLCKDELRCLGLEYLCDNECNCFDCSDEKNQCSKVDEDLLSNCSHTYFPTPMGPQCFCNSKDGTFDKLCKEIQNCTDQGYCDQRCSQYKNKIMCSCYDDYEEIAGTNGFRCRSKIHYGNMLLYSTPSQIKVMNLTSKKVTSAYTRVESAALAAGVNFIYYTTYNSNRKIIYQANFPFIKRYIEVIHSNQSITSFAIDYITRNIYFTTESSLSVCTNWGWICTQLKCCNVTHVALAPKSKLMFFTREASYEYEVFIMKSGMDGSEEEYLVDGTFDSSISLTVDESTSRLYWWEKDLMEIHSVSFSGENEIRSIKYDGTLLSFTALDGKLLFTKNRNNKIYTIKNTEPFSRNTKDYIFSLDTYEDSNSSIITDSNRTFAIRYINAYNTIWQEALRATNPCIRANCRHLCVLSPISQQNNQNYVCLCENFIRTSETNWCNNTDNSKPNTSSVATPVSTYRTTSKKSTVIATTSQPIKNTGTASKQTHEIGGHPILKGFLVIMVLAGVGCGIYYAYYRTNLCTHSVIMMSWARAKYTERLNVN